MLEVALLYTLDITYKPTSLDFLIDPSKEQKVTTDEEDDVSCEKTLKKCGGESTTFLTVSFAASALVA